MKLLRLLGLVGLVYGELERRVIGGSPTSAKPWMVYLRGRTSFCGGVLYTKSLVITAAHCNKHPVNEWRAYVNIKSVFPIPSNSQAYDVIFRINHPKHIPDFGSFDISVWWILGEPDQRTRVFLDDGGELRYQSSTVKVLGWGNTNKMTPEQLNSQKFNNIYSKVLLEATVPLIKDDVCLQRYPAKFISKIMFCTGGGYAGPGSGIGDSGGPVYRERNSKNIILLGTIGFCASCIQKNYNDVNTRISVPIISGFIKYYTEFFKPQNLKNGKLNVFIPLFDEGQLLKMNAKPSKIIPNQNIIIPNRNLPVPTPQRQRNKWCCF